MTLLYRGLGGAVAELRLTDLVRGAAVGSFLLRLERSDLSALVLELALLVGVVVGVPCVLSFFVLLPFFIGDVSYCFSSVFCGVTAVAKLFLVSCSRSTV